MTTPNDSDQAPSEQAQTPETDAFGFVEPAHSSCKRFARSLERRLAAQSAELEQHKTRIGIQAGRIAALESERNGLLSELEQARAEKATAEEKYEQLQSDIADQYHPEFGSFWGPEGEGGKLTARLAERDAQVAELARDKERLDWLEKETKSSRTGISFDWCRFVEDQQVVEKGYRFMRHHHLGDRMDTLRAAIDAATSKPQP